MKPNKLNIGWPTNSRLAKELQPLRDALELERQGDGTYVPKEFRSVILRELRAQDIAKFLSGNADLDAGITGRDIMTEQRLKDGFANEIDNPFDVDTGQPTRMQLLIREEDKNLFDNGELPKTDTSIAIVTSYPRIAEKAAENFPRRMPQIIYPFTVAGKIEQIVRGGLIRGGVLGMDIVKKGDTARANGLMPYGKPLIISRPGFYYKVPEWACLERENEVPFETLSPIPDFIAFIREKARATDIPLLGETDLRKRGFFEPAVANPL